MSGVGTTLEKKDDLTGFRSVVVALYLKSLILVQTFHLLEVVVDIHSRFKIEKLSLDLITTIIIKFELSPCALTVL